MKAMLEYIGTPKVYRVWIAAIVAATLLLTIVGLAMLDSKMLPAVITMLIVILVLAYMLRKSQRMTNLHASFSHAEAGLVKSIPIATDVIDGATKIMVSQKTPKASANVLDLLISDLDENHISYDIEDGQHVLYNYQGGYFRGSELGNNMIRIMFPRIYSTSPANQDMLCRILNRINSSYAISKLITVAGEGNAVMEVHGFADFYYGEDSEHRYKMLRDIMGVFFDQQRNLLLACLAEDEEMLKSEVDVTSLCKTAYKDISLN